jgi:hypothetical protein
MLWKEITTVILTPLCTGLADLAVYCEARASMYIFPVFEENTFKDLSKINYINY